MTVSHQHITELHTHLSLPGITDDNDWPPKEVDEQLYNGGVELLVML